MPNPLRIDVPAALNPSPLARPPALTQPASLTHTATVCDPGTSLALYLPATLRDVERAAAAKLPPHTLMARAGAAVADWLYARLPVLASAGRQPVLLLAGPGNNGGDAYVAAHDLHRRGVLVDVWQCAAPATDDARWAHAQAMTAGVPIRPAPAVWPHPATYAWIVDGLFGIGLSRPLDGAAAALVGNIAYAHAHGTPVLAIDIPSGLGAATGMADGAVIHADVTIAMLGACPGLFTGKGRDVAGMVLVASLGAEEALEAAPAAPATPTARPTLATLATSAPDVFGADLPLRRHASHKGSYGSLAVLGGHPGMVGAPLLCARAGLMTGAGRVYVGFVAPDAPAWDPVHPELMLRAAEDVDLAAMQAVCVGPGLGTSAASAACLSRALSLEQTPLVIDADALNLIAAHASLAERVRRRAGPTILTPHPLEAARLAGCSVADVESDRLSAARSLAKRFGAVVVLKGSGSIVDDGAGAWINTTGNAGLATAGTGDVLTGAIGALLAQGMPANTAALAGVWLHGKAADRCVAEGAGPAGLTASELLPAMRAELAALSERGARGATRTAT
ncbi:NAD(P)H-hydrate dehydratase [Pandoraea nosoerga]|uniref:Bifunctional NAD(P)H-hydrate repair enzyme n=1 Tax=Pandoraea nosoerga TaxID=2508296 RepID=A0A5E4SDY3_9BURK|nr:NAD(P)H-hydrate dehydratase [Pandoraea nosoerga]MBN4667007.1 NAD(P)H-hydrate dehydratase [Pandoraea nosoerga]MBN4674778.1 NAD(P)H-hydrate dehydratase [Pandoraea nosoerga]MBN4681756.1 NAD(P)H-hydrate dehydratase [Pandoraea nosoerga]MBN4744073.1 NAD(P)H-hydrate dehydratase [Pandoraea nosoerga]VVD73485.1 carbohydrate kinase [Pandoraea nosoerga]